MQDGDETDERSSNVDPGLDDIGPDDGGEAAFKRIDSVNIVMMAMDAISPVPSAIDTTMETA